jgi:hypothetical protein
VAERYEQCDGTCTVDCGHCKGAGRPASLSQLRRLAVQTVTPADAGSPSAGAETWPPLETSASWYTASRAVPPPEDTVEPDSHEVVVAALVGQLPDPEDVVEPKRCRCRNLADEHMPPAERIGDAEAKRRGLWSTTDCPVHTTPPAGRTGEDDEADVGATRWYVPAYVTQTGHVQPIGCTTVMREFADREADELRAQESKQAEGDPARIFVATRLELPWQRADAARPLVSGTANRDDVARLLQSKYGAQVDPLDHFPGAWLSDADELLALLGGDQDSAK